MAEVSVVPAELCSCLWQPHQRETNSVFVALPAPGLVNRANFITKKRKLPLLYPATEQLKLATEALPPTKKAKREVLKDFVNTANKIWENVVTNLGILPMH